MPRFVLHRVCQYPAQIHTSVQMPYRGFPGWPCRFRQACSSIHSNGRFDGRCADPSAWEETHGVRCLLRGPCTKVDCPADHGRWNFSKSYWPSCVDWGFKTRGDLIMKFWAIFCGIFMIAAEFKVDKLFPKPKEMTCRSFSRSTKMWMKICALSYWFTLCTKKKHILENVLLSLFCMVIAVNTRGFFKGLLPLVYWKIDQT